MFPPKSSLILTLALATVLLPGCAAVGSVFSASYKDLADKTVRVSVYDYGQGKTESAAVGKERVDGMIWLGIYDKTPASSDRILPYRWMHVVAPGAWDAGGLNAPVGWVVAMVADGVPALEEGDWVDLYVPESVSVAEHRWLTVVKRVCKHDDKACKVKEKAAVGKPDGQAVPATFDKAGISYTPHYDMDGNWLPGKKPVR